MPLQQYKKTTTSALDRFLLVLDIAMLVLVVINMLLIIFDWLFTYAFFQDFLLQLSPDLYNHYKNVIHPNFLLYDIWFVIIYLSEFCLQWIIAVWKRQLPRWYLYPIVHWYDLLGCIPVGAFRWLRLLRLFALLLRLHRMGVIDLTNTYIYKALYHIYNVIIEEITDRVFGMLIDSVKREVLQESPAENGLVQEIILPHQKELAAWAAGKIQLVTRENYERNKEKLKHNIETTIKEGLEKSPQIEQIMRVPLVGPKIIHSLEHLLSSSIINLMDTTAKNIYLPGSRPGLEETVEIAISSLTKNDGEEKRDEELSRILKSIISHTLDHMKAGVLTKAWMTKNSG